MILLLKLFRKLHNLIDIKYKEKIHSIHIKSLELVQAERVRAAVGDDFAVTYELNVYVDDPRSMAQIYSELHSNILDAFNEYGVQIMTPAYEGDPDQPKVVPKEQWFAPPANPPESKGQQ